MVSDSILDWPDDVAVLAEGSTLDLVGWIGNADFSPGKVITEGATGIAAVNNSPSEPCRLEDIIVILDFWLGTVNPGISMFDDVVSNWDSLLGTVNPGNSMFESVVIWDSWVGLINPGISIFEDETEICEICVGIVNPGISMSVVSEITGKVSLTFVLESSPG